MVWWRAYASGLSIMSSANGEVSNPNDPLSSRELSGCGAEHISLGRCDEYLRSIAKYPRQKLRAGGISRIRDSCSNRDDSDASEGRTD